MFALWLLIGAMLGCPAGFFAAALCFSSKSRELHHERDLAVERMYAAEQRAAGSTP